MPSLPDCHSEVRRAARLGGWLLIMKVWLRSYLRRGMVAHVSTPTFHLEAKDRHPNSSSATYQVQSQTELHETLSLKNKNGAGEKAQWLRAFASVTEVLGSGPWQLDSGSQYCNSSFKRSGPYFSPLWASAMRAVHRHTWRQNTHAHRYKLVKNKIQLFEKMSQALKLSIPWLSQVDGHEFENDLMLQTRLDSLLR